MKLGDVCEVVRGSSPRPKDDSRYYGGTVPRLMVADLTRDGKVVSARIDSLTELGAKQSRPMYGGDVVIAVSGAPGLPAILAHDVCIHDGFVGLRNLDINRVNPDFLYSYLMYVRLQNNRRAVGAIFKNLTTDQVREIEIPELEIAEQKRIATILDKAEELRNLRRQALEQLDAMTQSIFLEMFGDPNCNHKGIKSVSLSEVTTKITDGTHLTPQFIDTGVPFIFVKNVKNGNIDFKTDKFISEKEYQKLYERCPVEEGDIIYTTVGATYGQAALVGSFTKFAFQRHIAHLKPDRSKILTQFLEIVMQLPFVKRQADRWARGAAQPTINLKELREFVIPLPPLSLQQEFAQRVEEIEQLKATHRESLAYLDALFASLQHRAFRGEL